MDRKGDKQLTWQLRSSSIQTVSVHLHFSNIPDHHFLAVIIHPVHINHKDPFIIRFQCQWQQTKSTVLLLCKMQARRHFSLKLKLSAHCRPLQQWKGTEIKFLTTVFVETGCLFSHSDTWIMWHSAKCDRTEIMFDVCKYTVYCSVVELRVFFFLDWIQREILN